jgi:hypothetical protein
MSELRNELGKIKKIKLGFGGYQDAMIGISFDFGGDGWGCGDFWGHWSDKPIEGAEWTHESQIKKLGEVMWRINNLLKEAKVDRVNDLAGVPVRVFFKDVNMLSHWEVLTEVL